MSLAQLRVLTVDGDLIDTSRTEINAEQGVQLDDESFIAWERIVRVDQPVPARQARQGRYELHLRGGGRLVGTPIELVGETLHFDDANVGDFAVDLSAIRGMVPFGSDMPAGPSATDVLILANDDVLRGVVLDLSAQQVTIQTTDGQPITVDLATVTRMQLAPLGPMPDLGPLLVSLGGGAVYPVASVHTGRGNVHLEVARPEGSPARPMATISTRWLDRIEQVSGPVQFISDLPPIEAVHTPYLGTPDDTTVRAFELDGRHLLLRPRGVLTYEIPEGFTHLRLSYALAEGHRPLGNVSVRILLDGKPVHEASDVVSGVPVRVDVPIGDAVALTFEVDYGENYDVQDELLWLEPMLIKR